MHRNFWLRTLTRRWFARPSFSSTKRRTALRRVRLGIDHLENRITPSTVINVNDASGGMDNPANVTVAALGNNVTLRDAINAADNSGGSGSYVINLSAGQTITFASPVNNTTITSNNTVQNQNWYGPNALPAITSNITIEGNGDTLQISGTGMRFFYVSGGPNLTGGALSLGTLELDNLTLQGGVAQGGDGSGGGLGAGGAIFNQGNLTLNSDTLTNNQAIGGSSGPDIGSGSGGGMGPPIRVRLWRRLWWQFQHPRRPARRQCRHRRRGRWRGFPEHCERRQRQHESKWSRRWSRRLWRNRRQRRR